MIPFYLGIDLHLKRIYMVLMNANGGVIDKRRVSNDDVSRYLQEQVPKKNPAATGSSRGRYPQPSQPI